MFPQRQVPEIEESLVPKGADRSQDDTFFGKHGGKVAIGVISIIAASIYRWIQGGKNRTRLEDTISRESPLHPYESNEFRVLNRMPTSVYKDLVVMFRHSFPSGLISYEQFVIIFHQNCKHHIVNAYVLERVAVQYLNSSGFSTSDTVPLTYFLTLLSNAVECSPQERAELVFDLAHRVTPDEISFISQTSSVAMSPAGSNSDQSKTSSPSLDAIYCDSSQAIAAVRILCDTWQVCYVYRGIVVSFYSSPLL
jgi:hypothetical protein